MVDRLFQNVDSENVLHVCASIIDDIVRPYCIIYASMHKNRFGQKAQLDIYRPDLCHVRVDSSPNRHVKKTTCN